MPVQLMMEMLLFLLLMLRILLLQLFVLPSLGFLLLLEIMMMLEMLLELLPGMRRKPVQLVEMLLGTLLLQRVVHFFLVCYLYPSRLYALCLPRPVLYIVPVLGGFAPYGNNSFLYCMVSW